VKIVDKFQSEIRILNVCKSNSNSNFNIKVRKFELHFTSLVLLPGSGRNNGLCEFLHAAVNRNASSSPQDAEGGLRLLQRQYSHTVDWPHAGCSHCSQECKRLSSFLCFFLVSMEWCPLSITEMWGVLLSTYSSVWRTDAALDRYLADADDCVCAFWQTLVLVCQWDFCG